MSDYFISVIIPAYNAEETISRCLQSVFKSYYTHFECIVVDDHSNDDTLTVAESFPTTTIRLEKQQGVAAARNRGADLARGDILLFLDADVTIYPDTLSKVAKTFVSQPGISALFGSYDDQPGSPDFFSQYKNLFHHYIHQTSKEDASTFWGGCGAVRAEAFRKVGGFDQNKYSRPCIEDIEMGSRLNNMGYQIFLNKHLYVKHLKSYSFFTLLKSDLFDRAIPWTMVMLTNRQFRADLNLRHEHRLSAATLILAILAVFMTPLSIWFFGVTTILLATFFIMNHNFYRFFLKKKGLFFTLKVIPCHLLYYLYSTFGFLIGSCKYLYHKRSI